MKTLFEFVVGMVLLIAACVLAICALPVGIVTATMTWITRGMLATAETLSQDGSRLMDLPERRDER